MNTTFHLCTHITLWRSLLQVGYEGALTLTHLTHSAPEEAHSSSAAPFLRAQQQLPACPRSPGTACSHSSQAILWRESMEWHLVIHRSTLTQRLARYCLTTHFASMHKFNAMWFPFIRNVDQRGFSIFIKQIKGLNSINASDIKVLIKTYSTFFFLGLTWSVVYYLHNLCNIYYRADKTALSTTAGCPACHHDG